MSRQDPANRAKIWHEPLFDNMELLRASYTTHAFSLHFHEGFAVGVIEQGMQKARIGTVPDVMMPAGVSLSLTLARSTRASQASKEAGPSGCSMRLWICLNGQPGRLSSMMPASLSSHRL